MSRIVYIIVLLYFSAFWVLSSSLFGIYELGICRICPGEGLFMPNICLARLFLIRVDNICISFSSQYFGKNLPR